MRKVLVLVFVVFYMLVGIGAYAADARFNKISEHVYGFVGSTDDSPAASYGANAGFVVGDKKC